MVEKANEKFCLFTGSPSCLLIGLMSKKLRHNHGYCANSEKLFPVGANATACHVDAKFSTKIFGPSCFQKY